LIKQNDLLNLDKRFSKWAKGTFERYDFKVGVLNDLPHRNPINKTKSFAGGLARATKSKSSFSMAEVSQNLRKTTGINIYTAPFKLAKNKDILLFLGNFFQVITGKGSEKRLQNTLQAIIRNPILRRDYGKNTIATARAKKFNRLMIDTAQLFKNIKAKVTVRTHV